MADSSSSSPSLLDQALDDPGAGIMSLLAPIVTAGQIAPSGGQLLTQDQQSAAMPAFMAFASRLAAAGAPSFGPRTSIPSALVGAMGAGETAAMQAQMLPALRAQAAREAMGQELGLQSSAVDLRLKQQQLDASTSILAAPTPVTGGSGATGTGPGGGTSSPAGTPPPGTGSGGAPATQQQLQALPDFQAIPPQYRAQAIMAAGNAGMSLDSAAQWARILKQESAYNQFDPKNPSQVLTSDKGALGLGQVMPGTFDTMQRKYGISGTPADPMSNLLASAHYFQEGVTGNGGNLANATVRYAAGDGGLQSYLKTGTVPNGMPVDYLSKVQTPGAPGAGASALSATPPANPNDPMVKDGMGNEMPMSIYHSARTAMASGGLPAYSKVVNDYATQRLAGVTTQTGPGVQTTAFGKTEEAPVGATRTRPMTQTEVEAAGTLDPRMSYQVTERPDPQNPGQWVTTGPGIVPIAPRQSFAQLDQEDKLRQEYQEQQPFKVWNGMQPYLTRMRAVMARQQAGEQLTSADDYQLAANFAHLANPQGVVKEGEEEAIQHWGGLPGDIKVAVARIFGGQGGTFTPQQRQWLMQNGESEVGGAEYQAAQDLQRYRTMAQQKGIRPDLIGVPWNLSTWAKQSQAAQPTGAWSPGQPSAAPYVGPAIPHPGVVVTGQPVPGAGVVAPPGAVQATPVQGPPVAPATGPAAPAPAPAPAPAGPAVPGVGTAQAAPAPAPPPVLPGKVTAGGLQGLSDADLARLVTTMRTGRATSGYSSQEAAMAAAELRRRRGG